MTRKTLSLRITLLMAFSVGLLLVAALFLVLGYTRKTMRQDSQRNASEALDYTIQRIDNVLFSVEQSAGNLYFDIVSHLDDPDRMYTDARKLVEVNPYVAGCAIAMRPGYYPSRGKYFMAYYYQSTGPTGEPIILQSDTFGDRPYDKQEWYNCPLANGTPCWVEPENVTSMDNAMIVTYSMPIKDKYGSIVGVLGVDVSTVQLTNIVHATKPTPKSRALLMDGNGIFIIFPDSSMLLHQSKLQRHLETADASVKQTREAMYAGETGYRRVFVENDYSYVFYKPFTRLSIPGRIEQHLDWSVAIVFPEKEIMGDFIRMRSNIILVSLIGWLLLVSLCLYVTRRQLKPLRMLANSAQLISEGHYDEVVPYNRHHDEVATLQKNFRKMQMSLAEHMGRLQQLTYSLQERGKGLVEAYEQAKDDEHMKTAVLHNMSNKMITPANAINEIVETLSKNYRMVDEKEVTMHVRNIERRSKAVTELLDQLLEASQTPKTL